MTLTIRYKDGLRERKRTILNVCSIKYIDCNNTFDITTTNNDTGKEKITITGEMLEVNLKKDAQG